MPVSDSPLQLASMPRKEAVRLELAFRRGDPEAVAFFDELKSSQGECFLCGDPLQPGEGVAALMPDPAAPQPDLIMWGALSGLYEFAVPGPCAEADVAAPSH